MRIFLPLTKQGKNWHNFPLPGAAFPLLQIKTTSRKTRVFHDFFWSYLFFFERKGKNRNGKGTKNG